MMSTSSIAGRKVTLTFDNGPTPGITDPVLGILDDRQIRATFFMIGNQLDRPGGRDLARRAVAGGHRVGHHTATHTVLLGQAPDPQKAVDAEIADVAPWFEEFDQGDKLYRPYAAGGILDRRVFSQEAVRHLQDHGYTCVLWNSVPHDWDDPFGWVGRAMADIAGQAWTVVVLHDIDSGAMAQLPGFLDELSAGEADIVQDFPESCLPIRAGRLIRDLSHLTSERLP
jgi:peptidoglycan/xylan/chitin deacetylase (PgdA/CDA1 family)